MDKTKLPSMAKKIGALALAGVIGLGAGVGGAMMLSPEPIDVAALEAQAFEAGVDSVVIPEPSTVEVEKIVEVEKVVEVEVTDKYLSEALIAREIVDKDYDPAEVFMAEDAALAFAIEEIEEELCDVLEDEGIVKDEDRVDLIRIYSDWDDVTVLKSDFEDEEYKFKVKVKYEDTRKDKKGYALFTVNIEDGEAEIVNVEEL